MDFLTSSLLGIGLAMDCLAVSVCISCTQKLQLKDRISIPLHFGIFQGGMLLVGILLGKAALQYISAIDHWIAFFLLAFLGAKMIIAAIKNDTTCKMIGSYKDLLMLSIATSIDALAVGITVSIANGNSLMPALIVGIITLIISGAGLLAGQKFEKVRVGYAGIAGGVILIAIGIKTLIQHII